MVLEPGDILNRDGTGLALLVSLSGTPPDASLEIVLPGDYARLSLGQLLDSVFPEDEDGRLAVEEMLDVVENPDLPDIYDLLLPIFEQHRLGLCHLNLTAGAGRQAELFDMVEGNLQPASTNSPGLPCHSSLQLIIEPEYRALEYAVEQGYGENSEELLVWLRSYTALYFLDKHECRLLPPVNRANTVNMLNTVEGDSLTSVVEGLCHRQLLSTSGKPDPDKPGPDEPDPLVITPAGRRFIGALLSETEACIDRFDVFKDVLWDSDTGSAEFDTGYGEDLRVQVFIAEGLDPVRTVFLLRLYDGTLDEFASTWPELIGDSGFFNQILEPVVNRRQAPDDLLQAIIEDGYAYSEERAELDREERAQAQIARRLRAL